jgi:hypothetical protein
MAKGTATPSKVQKQREAAEALKGGQSLLSPDFLKNYGVSEVGDAAGLLKKIEADEAEAFQKFQEEQRAKREKALTDVLAPLNKQRSELSQFINEAHTTIAELDRQIAKLTGKQAPAAKAGGRQRAKRKGKDEKLQIATLIHGMLKQNSGKRYAAGELAAMAEGVQISELRKLWNEANKGDKIETEGNKAAARYFVGK